MQIWNSSSFVQQSEKFIPKRLGLLQNKPQRKPNSAVRDCSTSIYKKTGGVACTYSYRRLELLGLERLESRRIRADVLFAYKLLSGLTALHSNDFFILRESTCTRGHPYKLFTALLNWCQKYFFSQRIVKIWNELPVDNDFSSIESFKCALDDFYFNTYCDI